MKNKVLLFLLGIVLSNVYSQTHNCKKILQENFIEKIEGYKPTDLIPYNVISDSWEEKWGLMDRKTKKKLTKPLMGYASTFKPNLSFFYQECDVKITSDYKLNVNKLTIEATSYNSEEFEIKVLDSINGYRGFKVDSSGNLIAYSKAYFKENEHMWNISTPFPFERDYYAVVSKGEGNKVIINTKGEILKGIVYKIIRYTDYKINGENLLYVEDHKNNKGFITLSGSKFLYGKLLKSPFYGNEIFGYSIQHDGFTETGSLNRDSISKSGVLDLTKMKWLIKPKKGVKIIDMCYTSEIAVKTDYTNREYANIYFIVLEDKLRYLIDEKGNKYIPK